MDASELEYLRSYQSISRGIHTFLKQQAVDRTLKIGSQGEEDAVLAELLTQPFGTYVDVGAFDPFESSNTIQFYRRGWRGLLIEPNPACLAKLLYHRPEDAVYPVAVSNQDGKAVLRVSGSVSTLEPSWPIEAQGEIIVETMTLMNVLWRFLSLSLSANHSGGFQLCSIDVEGHERQVLEGINFDLFRPKVLCVESLSYTPDNTGVDLSAEWEHIITNAGYAFYKATRYNRIYVLKPTEKPEGENADSSSPSSVPERPACVSEPLADEH